MAEQSGVVAAQAVQASPDRPAFRDPTILQRLLVGFLLLAVLMSLIDVASNVMQHSLLVRMEQGDFASQEEIEQLATSNDARQQEVLIVQSAAILISIVLFMIWTHRANKNVRGLGATGLSFTPAMAVGCNFIPFLNLWMPFQAMSELWRASKNPANWSVEPRSSLIGWWWFLALAANFAAIASKAMQRSSDTLDALKNTTLAAIATNVFDVALFLIVFVMVSRIAGYQRHRWRLNPEVFS